MNISPKPSLTLEPAGGGGQRSGKQRGFEADYQNAKHPNYTAMQMNRNGRDEQFDQDPAGSTCQSSSREISKHFSPQLK